MRKRQEGFTLIELLVVVAIIGILAAIAIPNLIVAIQRSKQKRTMVDMRNLATAWEARAIETGRYNAAGGGTVPGIDKTVAITDLSTALSPTYIRDMPTHDGWGFPLSAFTANDWGAGTNSTMYALISPGKDGTISATLDLGATTSFDCDIVYSNGSFLEYPDGVGSAK